MNALEAGPGDAGAIAALFAKYGHSVSPRSLAARLADRDGGILLLADGSGCLAWSLDGGALHLYDIAAPPESFATLIEAANRIGRMRAAAVLVATLYEGDAALRELPAHGFREDYREADVAGGTVRDLVSLVREIG